MEITINIKNKKNASSFLELLKTIDYVEVVDVSEGEPGLLEEHRIILDERLNKVEAGEVTFKSWDLIKKKYGMIY